MTGKEKVLLVDDEETITANLTPFLERAGFSVATARDGQEALEKVRALAPNLIILDILMPRMDGREALRRLRHGNDWTPVILLTQVGGAAERTMALEEGADDYINKPFDPNELVARMRAVLRRVRAGQMPLASAAQLICGDLTLHRSSRRAYLGGQELSLTPKAVQLLEYLMAHPDELITRERLLDVVWGWDYPSGIRAVDARIFELRRALQEETASPRYIETVPGQGYRFMGEVEAR